MDTVSRKKRSEIMSAVRSVDSKAEMQVRSILRSMGYCYRLHDKKLIGKPDIVLKKMGILIFVHGCFWHRHNCKRATMPASNVNYWEKKFKRNVQRFKEVRKALKKQGWKVIVVWECQAKSNAWVKKLKPLK